MNLRETRWKKKIKTINSIPPPPNHTFPALLIYIYTLISLPPFHNMIMPFPSVWDWALLDFNVLFFIQNQNNLNIHPFPSDREIPFPPTKTPLSLRHGHSFPSDTDTPFPPTKTLLSLRHGHSFPSDTDTPFPPIQTLLSLQHGHSFPSDTDTLLPPTWTLFFPRHGHSFLKLPHIL